MGFSRQEYWSGLPFPFLGDLPNPGIEPPSLMSSELAGGFFTISTSSLWWNQGPDPGGGGNDDVEPPDVNHLKLGL